MPNATKRSAAEALGQVNQVQKNIIARGPREDVSFYGWGLWMLIMFSPFDYTKGNTWGYVVLATWVIGLILTFGYFWNKSRNIHIYSSTPWYLWLGIGLVTGLGVALATIYTGRVPHVWTVTGIVLALLYIGYGLKLRPRV